MRTSIFVASFIALLWPLTASANWQYTKWGMSVEDVKLASKGMATETSQDEINEYSPSDRSKIAKLSAPYSSGNFQFTAFFLFDSENKLACVHLELISGEPNSLIGALRTKYGKPESDDESSVLDSLDWYVGDDMVYIQKIAAGTGPTGSTTVGYQPRFTSDNRGL